MKRYKHFIDDAANCCCEVDEHESGRFCEYEEVAHLLAEKGLIEEQLRLANIDQATTEAELTEARKDAEKWRVMERRYIGGYEKGPNPSYLCRHRYRLADCITCLKEHSDAGEQK